MMTPNNYEERYISTAHLIVPKETYQRRFSMSRAQKIAEEFDERIANEPKVSQRNGNYYVFDGQHRSSLFIAPWPRSAACIVRVRRI